MNGNVLTCGLDEMYQNYGTRLTAVEKEIASLRKELVNTNQMKLNGYYNKIFEGIADFLLSRFSFNLWLKIRCDELRKESYGVEESEDRDPVEVIEQMLQNSLVRDRIIVGHRIIKGNGVQNGQKLPLLAPTPTSRKARTFRKRTSATLSVAPEDEGIYTGSAQKLSKSTTTLENQIDKVLQIEKASFAVKSTSVPSENKNESTSQLQVAGGAQHESSVHVSVPAELQPATVSEACPPGGKRRRKVQPSGGPQNRSATQHPSKLQDAGKIQVPGEITRDVQTLSRSVPSAISHGPRNQLQLSERLQNTTGMQAALMDPKQSPSTESLSRRGQNTQQLEPGSDSRSSSVSIQHTTVIQGPISLPKRVSNLPLALLNPNSNHAAATVPSGQYRLLPRSTSQHSIGCTQTDSEPSKVLPVSRSNVTIEKEVGSIIEIDITGDDEIEEENNDGSSTFSRPLFEMCNKVEPIPEEHMTIDQPETMSTTAPTIDNAIPNANGLPRRYIKSSRGPHLIEMVYEAPDDGSIEIHYDFNGELPEDEVEMPIAALKSKKQIVVKKRDLWKSQCEASTSQSLMGEEQILSTLVVSQESRSTGDFQSNSLNGSQISTNASQVIRTSSSNDTQTTSTPLSKTTRYEESTQASHEAIFDASTTNDSPPERVISPQHTTGEVVQHQTLPITRIPPPSLSSKETHPFVMDWLFEMKKYQKGLMPYTMFIKKDELRSWFEYLPQLDRSKSRYRCRLCYKFVGPFGIPKHHWGAMESAVGQLKRTEKENRDSINRHQNKASHVEVYNQLVKNVSRELRFTEFLDKNTKKELLRQLES